MAQIILDSNNNLIQGDFDNATLNNRTKLQTTTTNATTNVYVVPNGSSTSAGVSVANNSNLTNASKIVMATNGTTDTQIISGVNGSGTYLPLNFYTNNALSMTIDTNNNVGIGVSNPSSFDGNGQKLVVGNTSGNNGMSIVSGTANEGHLMFASGFGSALAYNGFIKYNQASNFMAFATNAGTERMRIDSSGGVSIGATATYLGTERFSVTATAAGWPMSLNCTASSANGLYIRYSTSPNNTGSDFFAAVDSTATRVVFRSNGGLANFSGNNVNLSDVREKTNIKLAGSYLDKICAIPVKTFNYIDQNLTDDPGLTLGVIAQDVQAVAPELVTESNWGTEEKPKERLSIYQTDLQYALMKCIQEQQTIINELKTRIEALESK